MNLIKPFAKFQLNHSYVVLTQDRTALHITILRITQKCYEFQIQGIAVTSWGPFNAVEAQFTVIEDLGIDKAN